MKKVDLKVDWCSYDAVKYACKNWHYSQTVPVGKLIKIGVWEDKKYIGCVVFSRGANNNIGKPYGLEQNEVCELTRVALNDHQSFVSEILAKSFKFLKRKSPNIRLIVSYADTNQGHHGGIYQATNWIYEGKTRAIANIKIKGKIEHKKTVYSKYGSCSISWLKKNIDPNTRQVLTSGKHKYLMPLDRKMRKKILPLSKPYPKK